MTRNQWLITVGTIGTVFLLICACAAVAGGALIIRNNAAAVSKQSPPASQGDQGAEQAPGESQDEPRSTEEDQPGQSEEPEDTGPVEAPSGSATRAGDTLTLPGGEPPTLDPHLAADASSATYIVEIFSGLVTLDRDLALQPDIATEWEVSDDGTLYTFTLRDDAAFANGRPITSEDFKYSIERACDPATESPVADTYLGDIVGCREKLRGEANEVSGVRAVEDQTLEIEIDAPKVYFLSKLTYPTAFVVDRETVEAGGRGWATEEPNGSGPFMLQEYTFGERVVLVPNPNYYGDPKPQLTEVVYTLSGGSAMTRYETGELDITPVTIADIDRVLDPANALNAELTVADELSISYIGFSVDEPPFDDPNVRRAFNMAVDKQALAGVVLREMAEPANTILPPGMPGYNADAQGLEYDPEQAMQLLEESSYGGPDGLPDLTLHTSGGGGAASPTLEAIVEMWRQNLGVEVAIEQTEFATFLSDLNRRPNPYQMYSIGWIADYPDPQDFLDILFHCESLDNHTGYCNEEVDELLEAARVETDEAERFELYRQAEEIILNDAVWVPLFYGKQYWLTKPYVEGMVYTQSIVPTLKYVSIRH